MVRWRYSNKVFDMLVFNSLFICSGFVNFLLGSIVKDIFYIKLFRGFFS